MERERGGYGDRPAYGGDSGRRYGGEEPGRGGYERTGPTGREEGRWGERDRHGPGSWGSGLQYERHGADSGGMSGGGGRGRWGYRYLGEGNFGAGTGALRGESWGRTASGGFGDYPGRIGEGSSTSSGTRMRRGPKGYKRSDERIREDVCDRLSDSDVDCEEVEVTVKNGEVTLTGTTDSGETRREIERVAEGVSGVRDVSNQIRMRREGAPADEGRKSGQPSTTDGSRRETSKSI